MCGAPCVVSPQMYMPTLPASRGVKSRSSRVAVSNSRRLTRRSLSARPSPPDHARAAGSPTLGRMAQPRLTSYERLDGSEVRAVLTYLGERIDTYLPRHPGLRAAVEECGKVVDGLLDRQAACPGAAGRARVDLSRPHRRRPRRRARRDRRSRRATPSPAPARSRPSSGCRSSRASSTTSSSPAIAIWFLLSLADRVVRNDLIRRLHRLRSMAHIIDMHQMSKDPAALLPDTVSGRSPVTTSSAPARCRCATTRSTSSTAPSCCR